MFGNLELLNQSKRWLLFGSCRHHQIWAHIWWRRQSGHFEEDAVGRQISGWSSKLMEGIVEFDRVIICHYCKRMIIAIGELRWLFYGQLAHDLMSQNHKRRAQNKSLVRQPARLGKRPRCDTTLNLWPFLQWFHTSSVCPRVLCCIFSLMIPSDLPDFTLQVLQSWLFFFDITLFFVTLWLAWFNPWNVSILTFY